MFSDYFSILRISPRSTSAQAQQRYEEAESLHRAELEACRHLRDCSDLDVSRQALDSLCWSKLCGYVT